LGVPSAFSWSASRHSTFDACRRRYYYAYYAAREDPEIKRLKALSALPMWAGSIVHETIEGFLRANDALPAVESRKRLAEESQSGSNGFRLFEHEYEIPVAHEDKRIAVTIVRRALRNFFGSRTLHEALATGRARWLSLEDLVSFALDDVKVLLRMDLAYRRTDGKVVIGDWKTGRGEARFGHIQVAGYALYAAEMGWVERPEDIETRLVYLTLRRTVGSRVDNKSLVRARDFIRRSSDAMRALLVDPDNDVAREEDFPRVDRPQVCRRCNFRRLCFPRTNSLAAQ
jgi:hypothetical protein